MAGPVTPETVIARKAQVEQIATAIEAINRAIESNWDGRCAIVTPEDVQAGGSDTTFGAEELEKIFNSNDYAEHIANAYRLMEWKVECYVPRLGHIPPPSAYFRFSRLN